MKLLLWFLGAAAVLNIAGDVWFRLAVSSSTHAPWYVWAPVIATMVVAVVTVVGQGIAARRKIAADVEPLLHESIECPLSVTTEEAARDRAAGIFAAYLPDHEWTIAFVHRTLAYDGDDETWVWRYTVHGEGRRRDQ